MKKLKVMTILGTRPEIIRLSATMKLLDKYEMLSRSIPASIVELPDREEPYRFKTRIPPLIKAWMAIANPRPITMMALTIGSQRAHCCPPENRSMAERATTIRIPMVMSTVSVERMEELTGHRYQWKSNFSLNMKENTSRITSWTLSL